MNTVIDDKRNLSFVNFGEIEASHLEAVAYMCRYAEIPSHAGYRTVITSGGGYPLDKTYYQTVKGMVGAMGLLEPGGDIIIFSECSEGMGSKEYVAAQRWLVELGRRRAFERSILPKSRASIDEWQTEMQLKPMQIGRIHLFSDTLVQRRQVADGCLLPPRRDLADRLHSGNRWGRRRTHRRHTGRTIRCPHVRMRPHPGGFEVIHLFDAGLKRLPIKRGLSIIANFRSFAHRPSTTYPNQPFSHILCM